MGKQLDQPSKLLMLLGLDQPNLPMLTLLLLVLLLVLLMLAAAACSGSLSASGSATVGLTESTTSATDACSDAYFDACFAPATYAFGYSPPPSPEAALGYATVYAYGLDAYGGSQSRAWNVQKTSTRRAATASSTGLTTGSTI